MHAGYKDKPNMNALVTLFTALVASYLAGNVPLAGGRGCAAGLCSMDPSHHHFGDHELDSAGVYKRMP